MINKVEIIGLEGIPLIKRGDNLAKFIFDSLVLMKNPLKEKDILIISQTAVSKSIGRTRNLAEIKPSQKAIEIYNDITKKSREFGLPEKSPEMIQAILDESTEVVKAEHVLITETKQGFVCANAGVDKSNVEGKENVALLPENSDEEAEKIRKRLKDLTGVNIAVIISDSFGRPFRIGAVGVALGVAGINPIFDKRGFKDLFGYVLQSKIVGQADSLASAAQLVMGEANEGIPVVLIRGYNYETIDDATIKSILMDKRSDLFRAESSLRKVTELLKSRRSYKLKFSAKPVEKSLVENCIEFASWAPSAHNGQFWRYIILDKGKVRENLIGLLNDKLKEDLTKDNKEQREIIAKIKKTRECFLEAPFLMLSCLDCKDLQDYPDTQRQENEMSLGIQSVSSSLTYFLIALHLNNLAGSWYCAPLFTKDIVKSTLKLPDSFVPLAFITVGYPTQIPKVPERKKLQDIIYELRKEG